MLPSSRWIVVTDFDGTLTEQDVGNELCKEFIPDLFLELQTAYRAQKLSLREMQPRMWSDFPCGEARFRERAAQIGRLRPGVVEFLRLCRDREVPVYVASCGLRPYIEAVLDRTLPAELRGVVREIRCNEARFEGERLARFETPDDDPTSPYPLDKGAWCRALRERLGARVLGIGNGSSDRTFLGQSDELAATEALATYFERQGADFRRFTDFRDLLDVQALRA